MNEKKQDAWLNTCQLMDGIAGLRALPKHSVDMILTDPPYGTTRNSWDVSLSLPEMWEAIHWAVKPNGAVLLFAQCPFDKVLGVSNLKELRYEWVFIKNQGTGFLNAHKMPLKQSENILVFYQKLPKYNPQFTYKAQYSKTKSTKQSSNYGGFNPSSAISADGKRYPTNVLNGVKVQKAVFPTQKPVWLCEYLIKTYTDKREIVADLCAGSGTTGIAAMRTGRRYYLFEKDETIFKLARKRLLETEENLKNGLDQHS